MSLRDKGTWQPPFAQSKQPDSLAMPARAFRGHGVQPGRCATCSASGGRGPSLPLKPRLFLHESLAAVPIPPLGHRLGPVARVKFQEDSVLELVNRRETQAEFIGD